LLRALRAEESTQSVPVLLISGWPHLTLSPDMFRLQPWSFLSKPFRPAALLQALGKLLRLSKRQLSFALDEADVVGSLMGNGLHLLGKKIRRRPRRDSPSSNLAGSNDGSCLASP
jgi:DNA-binding response OmpR family regulator